MNQKQKLWKAILIPTVSLFLICVVSTVLLAVTNSVTAPMIEDLAAKTAAETRQTVLSAAKRFSDPKTVTMAKAQYTYYEASTEIRRWATFSPRRARATAARWRS